MTADSHLQVVVYPRDDNPYQDLLHGALLRLGVTARYLPTPTGSHLLNVVLLPLQLWRSRRVGCRVLHLHWVYPFDLPGWPAAIGRRLGAALFRLFLWSVRVLGIRLVWTAHNVLPHSPIFTDDVRERRRLVDAADAVIAHSPAAITELGKHNIRPSRAVIAPHGPFPAMGGQVTQASARERLGLPPVGHVVLFFGRIAPYKGVADLLTVWPTVLAVHPNAHLVVAGACPDSYYRADLCRLASMDASERIHLRFGPVPYDAIGHLFAAADLVCLPFRQITTSGSAILALGFQRLLLIPNLEALDALTGPAVLRYPPGAPGLRDALIQTLNTDPIELQRLGEEITPATNGDWDASARIHAGVYRQLTGSALSDTTVHPQHEDHDAATR